MIMTNTGNSLHPNRGAALPVTEAQLPFDASRYWGYLESLDATEDEKAALLATLWDIMARFVESGFAGDPVRTVIPALIRAAAVQPGDQPADPSAMTDSFGAAAASAHAATTATPGRERQ